MSVTRATYATREDVKSALDIKLTARNHPQIDRAIEAGTDSVEGLLHRVFYTTLTTKYVDWPNFQSTYPWKVYLDAAELADVDNTVPVVTSGGNTIDNADIFWGNPRYAPPYTYFELNRASSASFGQGDTPQRDVAVTGAFGYEDLFAPAGQLAAAVGDTTTTTVQVSNAAAVGVGDILYVGDERMLVADRAAVSTGQAQQGSGVSTDKTNDVALTVTDGSQIHAGEVVTLDSERMLILFVTGNVATVKRAWDGTVLATHAGATVYADRLLTVTRGGFGSTAATHASGDAAQIAAVPGLVKSLTVAESVVQLTKEPGAYALTVGAGAAALAKIGAGLPDLRDRCLTSFGRTARSRTV